jgi:hypothetical protein
MRAEIRVEPPLGEHEELALRLALGGAAVPLLARGAWSSAAAREAVENDPADADPRYALSPRSTRGATRA